MDTAYFKKKLVTERANIEAGLMRVGRINPDNPNDWEPTVPEVAPEAMTELEERASEIEELSDNIAVEAEFELRLNKIRAALERIDAGTYGICAVCGKEIEGARLDASPSATTCKEHREEE